MSDPAPSSFPDDPRAGTLAPLPGEAGIPSVAQPVRASVSRKGIVAVALAVVTLIAFSTVSIQRFVTNGKSADDAGSKRAGDRPAAFAAERRLND